MRHYYKTHGSHCYLRSFKTDCPSCGAEVLYWECSHGSKIFFEYPPYGKLIKHHCKKYKSKKQRKKYNVIIKKPKKIFNTQSVSCPVCGKLFKEEKYLKSHINQLKNYDQEHKYFSENKTELKEKGSEEKNPKKEKYTPKFGQINIKRKKE
jgi:uncharacterized C2H2 Zn-finger protein